MIKSQLFPVKNHIVHFMQCGWLAACDRGWSGWLYLQWVAQPYGRWHLVEVRSDLLEVQIPSYRECFRLLFAYVSEAGEMGDLDIEQRGMDADFVKAQDMAAFKSSLHGD